MKKYICLMGWFLSIFFFVLAIYYSGNKEEIKCGHNTGGDDVIIMGHVLDQYGTPVENAMIVVDSVLFLND